MAYARRPTTPTHSWRDDEVNTKKFESQFESKGALPFAAGSRKRRRVAALLQVSE
jgi:hypothetical protein